MKPRCSRRTIAMIGLLIDGSASAQVLFRGDLETGTTAQFSGGPNQARVTVVTAPVREGRYAARAELTNADRWPNGLRRVELGYTPPRATYEGSERFYAFSVRISDDMPLDPAIDNSIAYWEAYPIYRQSMAFSVRNGRVTFALRLPRASGAAGGVAYTGDFAAGRWHDFVLHVRWSGTPSMGLVELWHNGTRVLAPLAVQTMVTASADGGTTVYPAFFHIGLLHGDFDARTQALLVDRVLEGTQLSDVAISTADGGVIADAGDSGGLAADSGDATAATDAATATDATAQSDAAEDRAISVRDDASATTDASATSDAMPRDDAAMSPGCACRTAERRGGARPALAIAWVGVALALSVGRRRASRVRP